MDVGAGHPLDRRVEVVEGLFLDQRRDVCTHPAMRPALFDDDDAVGLANRVQDRVEVERAQGSRVDHLGLDVVLAGELLGGVLGHLRHLQDSDDRHVGSRHAACRREAGDVEKRELLRRVHARRQPLTDPHDTCDRPAAWGGDVEARSRVGGDRASGDAVELHGGHAGETEAADGDVLPVAAGVRSEAGDGEAHGERAGRCGRQSRRRMHLKRSGRRPRRHCDLE